MDEHAPPDPDGDHARRPVEFTGRWQEFLPIALTNLLLIVVTLGVYRFWATARQRNYLWSRTRFIDDRLEWAGSGKEMFLGFLIVFLAALPVIALLMFAMFAASFGNELGRIVGYTLLAVIYLLFFYMTGVGTFRALRYRLSRTYWHGIRGGGDGGGWRYGWNHIWKTSAGAAALGLLIPWAHTSLWNDRMNRMSFGRDRFRAALRTHGLIGRWLLIYTVPIVFLLLLGAWAQKVREWGDFVPPDVAQGYLVEFVLLLLGGYVTYLLVRLAYYAAFYRNAVAATPIAGLQFRFTARSWDWVRLYLGHVGLVIVTLGVGLLFIGYRNWAFAVRHLDLFGEIDFRMIQRSDAHAPGDAEGLADAFDLGAI